jgi:hypothetical protein
MKFNSILSLLLAVCLLATGSLVLAQDPPPEPTEGTGGTEGTDTLNANIEEDLEWGDYTVKAYTLSIWGGSFGGATYLDNKPLGDRTVLTDGAGDIIDYDGGVLFVSRDTRHYDAAIKEVKPGDAFGGRIGIYIADDFHLDLLASYAAGEAVTSMLYTEEPDFAPNSSVRVDVDSDPDFKVYKGGLALIYNAKPATFFGIVPRLGFGLGGIINRYSQLEDKTALYLEGNLGLNYELFDKFELGVQADLTTFGFEVDELGYSQMVSYTTYSVGISWFIDRVPEQVRAAHYAEKPKTGARGR